MMMDPEGADLCSTKGPNNGPALRDAPYAVTPCPVSPRWVGHEPVEGGPTRCAQTGPASCSERPTRETGGRCRMTRRREED